MQKESPREHRFRHGLGELRIRHADDRDMGGRLGSEPLHARPEALDPTQTRQLRKVGGIGIGDDRDVGARAVGVRQCGDLAKRCLGDCALERFDPGGARVRREPVNEGNEPRQGFVSTGSTNT
jgi:hypothetical protein